MNDTPTPTPRSKIILDHIKIYVEADNAAQSYAHYKEVNREIESMERELTAVTEQLDRLAEALTEIARGEPNWADCVVLAREAIQSLNPDHTVDANDMIAAVKGVADE